jgi:zeaxanthin glucosyltransferase
MTHFGILCPVMTGHLNSLIPLGQALKLRGHQVTFFQLADAEKTVRGAGLEFQAFAATECPVGSVAKYQETLGKLSGLAALRYTLQSFQKVMHLRLQQVPELIRQAGVEALIIDQTFFEGGTIAELLDLPFITFCSALPLNISDQVPPFGLGWNYNSSWWGQQRNRFGHRLFSYIASPLMKTINHYRQHYGLRVYEKGDQPFSSLAQISQQPIEFEFPRTNLPPYFHFVGCDLSARSNHSALQFPFEKLTGQPLIYASLGSVLGRHEWIFERIAKACESLPVQLVISLGQPHLEQMPILPGSAIVVPYAPQIELLKRASLTITHAGLNTVLEALGCGVPLVAIPIANDQPGVASRLAWSGAGERILLSQLTVARLRSTIQTVLTNPSYRENAQRLQAANLRAGSIQRATDIVIVNCCSTTRPSCISSEYKTSALANSALAIIKPSQKEK